MWLPDKTPWAIFNEHHCAALVRTLHSFVRYTRSYDTLVRTLHSFVRYTRSYATLVRTLHPFVRYTRSYATLVRTLHSFVRYTLGSDRKISLNILNRVINVCGLKFCCGWCLISLQFGVSIYSSRHAVGIATTLTHIVIVYLCYTENYWLFNFTRR